MPQRALVELHPASAVCIRSLADWRYVKMEVCGYSNLPVGGRRGEVGSGSHITAEEWKASVHSSQKQPVSARERTQCGECPGEAACQR